LHPTQAQRGTTHLCDSNASPKISEKPDPKRTSGARVAFSTSSQPIFAAEPQAVPA